jgi:hypothetical protein
VIFFVLFSLSQKCAISQAIRVGFALLLANSRSDCAT